MASLKTFGLIVNPIAGMGGKVALKGTDGAAALSAARARGARPESGLKAERALKMLLPFRENVQVLTASGDMGQSLCEKLGLPFRVVCRAEGEDTSPSDTMAAARAIADQKVELLLFAGGDGTARNICEAVGERVSVLGIPAGVKIQSAVFALDPEAAGTVAATLARGVPMSSSRREVVDLDEDAYRTGRVSATLYGAMLVPDQPEQLQSMKQSGFSTEADQMAAIAGYLEEHMESGVTYAIGSGSSAKCISQRLGLPYELLGVDVIRDGKLIERDVTEEQLWSYAKDGAMRIIVSPIGGQGFLFGRGNHQFSARVLRAVGKERIIVISPESKVLSIQDHTLHIDCGDPEVNQSLRGFYSVLCGYGYFLSLPCR
ncbi:ATP-NAD kinase family protein [Oscillibacter sp. MSJ-2]|uniref:ATP-NAD kinase family protein n=1 Tax=Dysosmobacter acutus TaxID=2841504 RepID=A0ABS6F5L9_9FIRM|nr:ATP-NAD kinase family protein [Dysosmobacter acutus]MBU5625594.1 ATP-NAD kinase family protein [Dysosmobacter acutus]